MATWMGRLCDFNNRWAPIFWEGNMECCSMRFQQETSSLHMAPQFLHCVVTMPQLLLTKLTMHDAWFLLPMFCSSLAHQKTKNVFQTNWNCSTCEPSKSSKISLKSKYQPKKKDPLWASAVLPTLLLPWWCEARAPWSALSALSWEAAHPRMSDAEKNWLFQKVSVFQYHQAKSKVGKVGLSVFFKSSNQDQPDQSLLNI